MGFKPGVSGNPKGRPRGIRSRIATVLDGLSERDAVRVYEAMVALAVEQRDPAAARLILDRAWPPPKGRRLALDLPELRTVDDARVALGEVIRATAAGELTPAESRDVAALLVCWRVSAGAAGASPPDAYAGDDLDFSTLSDDELKIFLETLDRAAIAARRRRVGGGAAGLFGSNLRRW